MMAGSGVMGLDVESREHVGVPTGILGVLFFLTTEIMLFAGLLSAYWVIRSAVPVWPPIGQPRLPLVVTGVNTAVLLFSGAMLFSSTRLLRAGKQKEFIDAFFLGLLSGAVFLVVQGYEWFRLLQYGLTLRSSTYGATFYFIIGMHAFHAFLGIGILSRLFLRARQGHVSQFQTTGFDMAVLYWGFVVAVWPVLFVCLYLI